MCYTTKTKVHSTLSFHQSGQKIRKCSVHTGAPHFPNANLVLFRCSGPQIWQRFLVVSNSWTCAGYRWRQIRKCRPTVGGGPNGWRHHLVAVVGPVALVTGRYLINENSNTDLCIYKPSETRQNAGSGVFRNLQAKIVESSSKNRAVWQLEQISYANRTSQELQWKLSSPPSQGKILKRKVSDAWEAITERSNNSRGSTLLLVNNVLIDPPNQHAWYRMNMSKRFCRIQAKLALTSFLLEHFKCTLPLRAIPPTWLYNSYADFENAARKTT